MTVLQFPNGSANLTYLLTFGERRFVLRRPPFGVIAPGAHDMAREHRVLSRLWQQYDRAPRAFVLCEDHDVVGADFVVSRVPQRRSGLGVAPAVDGRPARRRPTASGWPPSTRSPICTSPIRRHAAWPISADPTGSSIASSPAGASAGISSPAPSTRRRWMRPPTISSGSSRRRRWARSCTTTSSSTTASSSPANPIG